DSIAVNGVCLTVIEMTSSSFSADVSAETLRLTSLGKLGTGSPVNLEKALTLQTRLGGHMVSGHVDALGEIMERRDDARSIWFKVEAPDNLAKYIVHKGSITVDGTSLTVNAVDGNEFELNIVPHTAQETIMSGYQPGTQINLEVDIVGRYLERLLLGEKAAEKGMTGNGVDLELLQKAGFV
ncbi:MAG: riboflavin synthase, partial [Gammaproteobacteria bacterium]|nr:riboflavin synthase [Gammaproteobacteria bacterium]